MCVYWDYAGSIVLGILLFSSGACVRVCLTNCVGVYGDLLTLGGMGVYRSGFHGGGEPWDPPPKVRSPPLTFLDLPSTS